MRTTQDIQLRITELKAAQEDFFGFQRSDLIYYLPFEQAKPFIENKALTEAEWLSAKDHNDKDSIIAKMLDYMSFAWNKANNYRGLSASRSIDHYRTWLWLLEDDLGEELSSMYEFYGKSCLVVICEKYNWNWKQWDNDHWKNDEDELGITADKARKDS